MMFDFCCLWGDFSWAKICARDDLLPNELNFYLPWKWSDMTQEVSFSLLFRFSGSSA